MTTMQYESLADFVRALDFAADKHRDQRRKDERASPYINHPIALTRVLIDEAGVTDPVVLCAALLHDTIEDTATTEAELIEHFGDTVTAVVLEVSDDRSLAQHERKRLQIEHAPQLSEQARLVKLADKICNLRDILDSPPPDWSRERQRAYFDWAGQVIDGLRGTHAALEAVFDQVHAQGRGL
ncbi:HD domain-containing protein [Marichromatium sp. PS1]|uniref:HD domain-containing protein n=1 Tax=Marichromatium sp. PS1 TaxID=3138932 RepID=UPI0034E8F24E